MIRILRKERNELAEKLAKIDALLLAYGEELKDVKPQHRAIHKEAELEEEIDEELEESEISKEKRIKLAVIAFLNERGQQHRKIILDHLIARGLMGNEKDPMQRLAKYLNGMNDVVTSDGAGNFRLKERLRRI